MRSFSPETSIRPDFCGCGLYVQPFYSVVTRNSALTLDPAWVPALDIFRPSQNARVSVMGSGQLSQVMQSVSRSVPSPIPAAYRRSTKLLMCANARVILSEIHRNTHR
jgi:hypothetical protein